MSAEATAKSLQDFEIGEIEEEPSAPPPPPPPPEDKDSHHLLAEETPNNNAAASTDAPSTFTLGASERPPLNDDNDEAGEEDSSSAAPASFNFDDSAKQPVSASQSVNNNDNDGQPGKQSADHHDDDANSNSGGADAPPPAAAAATETEEGEKEEEVPTPLPPQPEPYEASQELQNPDSPNQSDLPMVKPPPGHAASSSFSPRRISEAGSNKDANKAALLSSSRSPAASADHMLMPHGGDQHFMVPTKSSSFREAETSSAVQHHKRSDTPHRDKPSWKPTSSVPDLLANARHGEPGGATKLSSVGPMGPIRPPPTTSLFHQLHLSIYQRPPIGNGAVLKKQTQVTDSARLPYSLLPPAALNASMKRDCIPTTAGGGSSPTTGGSSPQMAYGMFTSALNTSITSSVYATRKPPSSVLSVLCVTGDAETDASVTETSCLRILPCLEDHRSVAIERIMPTHPRDGARFAGSFIGEDSTFLSREFKTFDGVAAFQQDWDILGDLIGGDFLSGSVARGLIRSGVVVLQSGPGSEPVTNAFSDGTHPFMSRINETLIFALTKPLGARAPNLSPKHVPLSSPTKRTTTTSARSASKKKPAAEENDAALTAGFVDESTESSANPFTMSPTVVRKQSFHSRDRTVTKAKTDQGKRSRSKDGRNNNASGSDVASSSYSSSPSPLRAAGAAAAAAAAAAASPSASSPSPSKAVLAVEEIAAELYSFDHVAVGAVDIAPGEKHDDVFDVLSGTKLKLVPKKRYVPKKLHPVPTMALPPNATTISCTTETQICDACTGIMHKKRAVPGSHRLLLLQLRKSQQHEAEAKKATSPVRHPRELDQLTYEPTIVLAFLSPLMRKRHDSSVSASLRAAIQRDHRELFVALEHVAKYDGAGKEALMLQPVQFSGMLTTLLTTYGWLRADVCHTVYLASVKAFCEAADEAYHVIGDVDRVKMLPVHPRAHTSFLHRGLPPIELPPLLAQTRLKDGKSPRRSE